MIVILSDRLCGWERHIQFRSSSTRNEEATTDIKDTTVFIAHK